MVPAFTYMTGCLPDIYPNNLRQNAWPISTEGPPPEPFRPETGQISKDMGAIPAAVLKYRNRKRSLHPQDSFAALGPLAEKLTEGQDEENVYAPYEVLMTCPDSYLILAGVGLDSATPIHFAEAKSGRKMFIRWSLNESCKPVPCRVGGCSDGFPRLQEYVGDLCREIKVGESRWMIFPFPAFVNRVKDIIIKNPEITHCGDEHCPRCHDAILGGPYYS